VQFIKENFSMAKLIYENTMRTDGMVRAFVNRIRNHMGYSYRSSDDYILQRMQSAYDEVKKAVCNA
jgi:hypothetical protein